MCTNGSGTNSVKPPLRRCWSRRRRRWRAQLRGPSTWPNMIVVVDAQPLAGRDLVRAEHASDLVVEDLGRGAGERAEPSLAQAQEVVLERGAERRGALPDLERGERVHV